MDIKVTITATLPDNFYGFSDLLDGNPLDEFSKEQIKELLMEDLTDVIEGQWKIEAV